MGKTDLQATAAARKDIAEVIRRFTEIAATAVEGLTAEQIQAGFALPSANAPKWTNMVERIVGSAARGEMTHPTQVNRSLNLVIVGKAESTEKWIETVKASQRKKPAVIDVPAEPKK